MAFVNPRVTSFSQYLLRDDKARKGPPSVRYGGFESGLRFAGGKDKPSLRRASASRSRSRPTARPT